MGSRIQQWNLSDDKEKVHVFRSRQTDLAQFFKAVGNLAACDDVDGLVIVNPKSIYTITARTYNCAVISLGRQAQRHFEPRGANYQPELSQTKDIPAYINITNHSIQVTLAKDA